MSTKNKYTPEFKKTIVNLYHSGKSYSQIHAEYGVSSSALSKWVKLFSEVKSMMIPLSPHSKSKICKRRNYPEFCVNSKTVI